MHKKFWEKFALTELVVLLIANFILLGYIYVDRRINALVWNIFYDVGWLIAFIILFLISRLLIKAMKETFSEHYEAEEELRE
jgi:hypothetical protein